MHSNNYEIAYDHSNAVIACVFKKASIPIGNGNSFQRNKILCKYHQIMWNFSLQHMYILIITTYALNKVHINTF